MVQIACIPVTQTHEIKTVAVMAKEIWTEYYPPIIGRAQIKYMLQKFQTSRAIKKQIDRDGYSYYLLSKQDDYVGYCALVQKKKEKELFISKFYICSSQRHKGIATLVLRFIEEQAAVLHCNKIALAVNRANHQAIRVYQHLGFKRTAKRLTDIGAGFFMDDYLMEKKVPM